MNNRAWIVAQPVKALLDDTRGLTHFLDPHQIAVVTVAIRADRDIEIHAIVDLVWLHLAQIPEHAGTAQHRPGESELLGTVGVDDADVNRALLPDSVVCQ
jgi:hypothetical protein